MLEIKLIIISHAIKKNSNGDLFLSGRLPGNMNAIMAMASNTGESGQFFFQVSKTERSPRKRRSFCVPGRLIMRIKTAKADSSSRPSKDPRNEIFCRTTGFEPATIALTLLGCATSRNGSNVCPVSAGFLKWFGMCVLHRRLRSRK